MDFENLNFNYCACNVSLDFYVIQIYIYSDQKFRDKNISDPIKMWEILLNSVLNGWLKWAVLLTNCKWAVVNSIRIQKWATHSYKSQMGNKFSATHFWPY